MLSGEIRRTRTWLGTLIAVVALLATVIPASAADGDLKGFFNGSAYGTKANAVSRDIAVQLGRSAYQPCPCPGTDGAVRSNTVDTVDAGDAFRAATILSTAQADKVPVKQAYIRMTSTTEDVDALDGLVTADMIRAVARVDATRTSFSTSTKGSKILGLEIAGEPVAVTPGARFRVPGFGYVVVKDVDITGDGVKRRGIAVDMLTIVITKENDLDIPVGTEIIVGHAAAAYDRSTPVGLVGGSVFAADAVSTLGSVENRLGKAAAEYLGCISSGVKKNSNYVINTDRPGTLESGPSKTTLKGAVNDDRALARGTSTIEGLDVLAGLITADFVKGVVNTKRLADGTRSVSYDGSRFGNLRVSGVPVEADDDVGENTERNLPGVGTVTFFETNTSTTADEIRGQVIMIHVELDFETAGLPAGTEIRVGFARTQVETP